MFRCKRNSTYKKSPSIWLANAVVLGTSLLASPAVLSQQGASNWAKSFVTSRVAARNIQTINTGNQRLRMAQIRRSLEVRIVGGNTATPNENPFQVGLLLSDESNNARAQFCGGTLVAPNKVVTAAHCSDFMSTRDVQVLTGTRRLDGTGTRNNVSRITVHPDWDSVTFDNDVAVWELSSDVSGVPFATLATSDGSTGADLLVTGWGNLSQGGSAPIALQAVDVPLVTRSNCNDSNSYDGAITSKMICAGFEAGGQDSCQGDSGGPLTRGQDNSVLTGVVSWGFGCAQPNLFGVYARVSETGIRSFLQGAIGVDLADDCVGFNNANLQVQLIRGDVKIVDGSHWLFSFGNNRSEAERALTILKSYRANQSCFVGRPNPEMSYFLTGGNASSGSVSGEDCIRHDLSGLRVLDEGSKFILTDGRSRMISFDRRVEAQTAISIMRKHDFSRICYVGRPGPSFKYMKL